MKLIKLMLKAVFSNGIFLNNFDFIFLNKFI